MPTYGHHGTPIEKKKGKRHRSESRGSLAKRVAADADTASKKGGKGYRYSEKPPAQKRSKSASRSSRPKSGPNLGKRGLRHERSLAPAREMVPGLGAAHGTTAKKSRTTGGRRSPVSKLKVKGARTAGLSAPIARVDLGSTFRMSGGGSGLGSQMWDFSPSGLRAREPGLSSVVREMVPGEKEKTGRSVQHFADRFAQELEASAGVKRAKTPPLPTRRVKPKPPRPKTPQPTTSAFRGVKLLKPKKAQKVDVSALAPVSKSQAAENQLRLAREAEERRAKYKSTEGRTARKVRVSPKS